MQAEPKRYADDNIYIMNKRAREASNMLLWERGQIGVETKCMFAHRKRDENVELGPVKVNIVERRWVICHLLFQCNRNHLKYTFLSFCVWLVDEEWKKEIHKHFPITISDYFVARVGLEVGYSHLLSIGNLTDCYYKYKCCLQTKKVLQGIYIPCSNKN